MKIVRCSAALILPLVLLAACADSSENADATASATATAPPTQATAQPAEIPTGAVTPEAATSDPEAGLEEGDLTANWLEPVDLTQPVAVSDDVTVGIGQLSSRHIDAVLPDEVSGDGLIVPVTVANTGTDELSLAGFVVTMSAGEGDTPVEQVVSASDEVPATIAPGQAMTINTAFVVPQELRGEVSIVVDLGAQKRAAVFQGAAPAA
ncbi:hypothetical protein [Actinomyces sp.]|uniref:hypothetical protein n=1 Tax=Actinomyces sp. TaxID=29317 RepID=UPI0026DD57CC|nr:hypothetical protein [Actinomyces sp.]MDO4901447.1 hypothetical protein [Actinomyces sp.]